MVRKKTGSQRFYLHRWPELDVEDRYKSIDNVVGTDRGFLSRRAGTDAIWQFEFR